MAASQRQRVPNIGASSSACTSTSPRRGGLEEALHVLEREAVRRPERQHDAVLERRGLELEVELAAEALAQRQSPGPVDARAVGRVDDEVGVAHVVEEALEHDGVERRQRAERRLAGGEVLRELLGRDRVELAVSSRSQRFERFRPAVASRPSASSRRRETAAESSSLRAGASPTQNGSVGAMPRASSTKTLFTSTFCTRYEVLPSWKMSPGMLSNAKSSPIEPMRRPSGFSTTS